MLRWGIKVILKIEDQRLKIKINLKRSPLVIFSPKRSRSPVVILKIKIKDRDLCPSLFAANVIAGFHSSHSTASTSLHCTHSSASAETTYINTHMEMNGERASLITDAEESSWTFFDRLPPRQEAARRAIHAITQHGPRTFLDVYT